MAEGIKDKIAIIGMGCTRFGERWEDGPDDLMVEAFTEAVQDAGIDRKEIEASWLARLKVPPSVSRTQVTSPNAA